MLSKRVPQSGRWQWQGRKLFHHQALDTPISPSITNPLRKFVVERIYADQNSARNVKQALKDLVTSLGDNAWGLNLGAGGRHIHERLLNIDVRNDHHIQIVTLGSELPFDDNSLSLIIAQEVLEHIADPWTTVNEAHRVLAPSGVFYVQVPFQIGYHPGPSDYWRFTKEGLRTLFPSDRWSVKELDIVLGFGSGFYRIAVEFFSVPFSALSKSAYIIAKTVFSITLWPLKLLDPLTKYLPEQDRIAAGYFIIVEKV